ncbi:hydrogenase-4 component E [Lebetimonas natsushimae]|uniref:Hydrogenase-4 component E n=1 Tax=Lebetimonas natsushimae TaxID=1936991 RepID=A0A292YB57_9BACT|nr:hydrogenase [Lebetimonas natsushimae]GAX87327.1 hydrogenase-4 component E [Lebetimonas natsushimae]
MVNILIGFFIAFLIIEAITTRLYALYFWYGINSLFLGLIALLIGLEINDKALLISGSLTIIIKALLIPVIMKYLTQKFDIPRKIIPKIPIYYQVIIIPIILVFTYYLITPIINNFEIHKNYIAISIAALFISMLITIEHKNIAAQIIGFLNIENSLFLLGISATEGMPMLVELGIFVDLLMLIIIINLLFRYQGE